MLQCAQKRTGHAGRPITYWDSNPSWAMKSKLTQVNTYQIVQSRWHADEKLNPKMNSYQCRDSY